MAVYFYWILKHNTFTVCLRSLVGAHVCWLDFFLSIFLCLSHCIVNRPHIAIDWLEFSQMPTNEEWQHTLLPSLHILLIKHIVNREIKKKFEPLLRVNDTVKTHTRTHIRWKWLEFWRAHVLQQQYYHQNLFQFDLQCWIFIVCLFVTAWIKNSIHG